MNQFFSFNRFKLLVLMHWAHNRKRYGLSVLALMGALIVKFLFTAYIGDSDDRADDAQKTTFFFFLFVIGTFYASQYFQGLGSKARAGNFLLVPASIFEKLLCGLMYTVVLFIIAFTSVYYLVDILVLNISREFFRTKEHVAQDDAIINVFKVSFYILREDFRINALLVFLSVQSAFLLGSIYFKKYSFLKTIISGFVVYALLFGVTYISCQPLFPGDRDMVRIPGWVEQIFGIFLMYVVAPFLWILTYYRLKQKQA